MKQIEVIRYFSNGYARTPQAAAEKIAKLRERHPDRDYVVLSNSRAYYRNKLNIVQVKTVYIHIPEEGIDYHLPVKPKRADYVVHDDFQQDLWAWEDLRTRAIRNALKGRDIMDPVKGSINKP